MSCTLEGSSTASSFSAGESPGGGCTFLLAIALPGRFGLMPYRIKKTARVALKAFSAAVDPLLGSLRGPRILIYHQVGTDFGREMEVAADVFSNHLDWLRNRGEIVDLDTAIGRRGDPGADRLFVLTFDDGFEDVYHNAFPLMEQWGIPFTLYLTTRPIQTGEPIDPRYPDARPLTWDQVNEMAATGLVTVGAHTHSHPDMRTIPSDIIAEELDTSNRLIEEEMGLTPRHFTYPWGWWSEAADPLVRSHYETATVGSPSSARASVDMYALGRFPVQASDGVTWFTRRMRGGFRIEDGVRRKRAGYSGP